MFARGTSAAGIAMKRKKTLKPPVAHNGSRVHGDGRVVERPDGYYWIGGLTRKESGPYKNLEDAIAAMPSEGEADFEPGESLEEAEDEIGIANWVDPDTGAPAEEGIPRLEDH